MKFLTALFFILLIHLGGCAKEDDLKLEAFNAEAFAYDIGGTWEVNASARVRGFRQLEENQRYFISLSYEIDVITPGGDTLKSMISRIEDKEANERLSDIPLDVQFELDSTFSPGNYTLIFHISDPENGNYTVTKTDFDL